VLFIEWRSDCYSIQLGTAAYRAPEMLCDNYQYSSPIDVWAAGCVFAEMITGLPLFQNRKLRDELEAIFRYIYPFHFFLQFLFLKQTINIFCED